MNEEEEHDEYSDEDEDEANFEDQINARVNNTKTSVRSQVLSVSVQYRYGHNAPSYSSQLVVFRLQEETPHPKCWRKIA